MSFARPIILLTLGALAPGTWNVALAQCPDGTPPPCRVATPAPARRANPPLDDRTWIVLPFENVTRASDIDWLRDASVNLLYLDMSRWRDIRVIDDERVADFMREVPSSRGPMGLQAGIAVARRAGAGKLVMGDLLKVGSRTAVVAKVFDVRTGQRLRSVREEAPNPDSILPVFGRLARGILAADMPTGASLGIGTTRLDAYQEYLAGVRALNAFDLAAARPRLERAIQLDSAFALAYYKLAILIGWSGPGDPAQRRYAEAAARFAAGLPNRERTLITAEAQAAGAGEYWRACETLAPLVRGDSNDVEALYNFGECSYHDNGVVPVEGDTSRFRFRNSWNRALWAFRRVLALDPSYHLAFQHIGDALQSSIRAGCLATEGRLACGDRGQDVFGAAVRREGDSLLLVPVRQRVDARRLSDQFVSAQAEGSRRRNLEEALRAAEEWRAAGPAEVRAGIAYARALLRLGRVEEAAAAAARLSAGRMSWNEAGQFLMDRVEIALKTGVPGDARRLVDSLRGDLDSVPDARVTLGVVDAILGRPSSFDSAIVAALRAQQAPPAIAPYLMTAARALLGLPADSLPDLERSVAAVVPSIRNSPLAAGAVMYSFRTRGPDQWTVFDTASADPRLALVSWLAVGDTSRFRRQLTAFDSLIDARRGDQDGGVALLAAEAHLALRDTAGALARLRRFRDESWRVTSLGGTLVQGFGVGSVGMVWPRTFLLLGDVAAATGQRAEAIQAYRLLIGMWERGEAEVQPTVQRVREAVARLGGA